jgi:hypothetical protein
MKLKFMWHSEKQWRIACTVALLTVMSLVKVQAGIVALNLSGIPDGTPVSANNPYSGVVNLHGQADFQFMGVELPYPSVNLSADNGSIRSGAIWMGVNPLGWPEPPPGTDTDYRTQRVTAALTATFLQPVIGLAFTTEVFAYSVNYQFEGLDGSGSPFSGSGSTSDGSMQSPGRFDGAFAYTMNLNAPEGGYFTKLALSNWAYGGGSATFQVYDIAVQTLGVPEPSNFTERAFLLLLVVVAPLARQKGLRSSLE